MGYDAPPKFEDDFPQLQDVQVEEYESRVPTETDPQNFDRPYTLKATWGLHGGIRRCHNKLCERGGYHLRPKIQEMISGEITTRIFVLRCPGDHGSPKGRRRGPRCPNVLHCRLTLIHKAG